MEDMGQWLNENWLNLFSSVGIIGSLWFTAVSLHSETKTRRVSNLLSVTANHREIWKIYLDDKQLARIRDASADTREQPITEAERVFVGLVIHHISTVYFSTKDQLVVKFEGWRRDIAQFLSLPIPREVWDKIKVLQNDDFAAFVESCRNWK
jgi:hypothetical protein